MESKKINQLATNVAPQSTDLTIIGDPITGVSKKITWLQVSTLIGTAANLQQVTDNGATTTNPIAIGGLTITGLATGVLKSDSGVISSVPFGAANGVATLGGDGKVPSSQLPSYVDDVVEVANYAALPAIGETGKIYITLDNNKVYRWTGSIYVEIAANNAVWGAITGTLSNQTDLQNALNTKLSSVGLSMPSGFSVASSPLTSNGTIAVTGAGNSTQYLDGTGALQTFPTLLSSDNLVKLVRNQSGATMTAGTVIYISGATGNKPLIAKALATGDATSAQTYGVVQANIANNADGYIVIIGNVGDLDTSALTEGQQLYLSATTAGEYTTTKQYAPNHLVYVGIVLRSHPTQGIIGVKIQNGYEMDELHNVAAQSPSNGDILQYVSSTSLWTKTAGTTTNIAEGTNLYFTDTRARNAISLTTTGTSGVATYSGGVLNIPNYGSALSGYVPYTGATANVDLGAFNLTSTNLISKQLTINTTSNYGGSVILESGSLGVTGSATNGITLAANSNTVFRITSVIGGSQFRFAQFNLASLGNGQTRTYTLPDADGTVALTSDLSSYIQGSGTTNYVPKFTASGTIGNSLIYDTGTRIAIGGTSATYGVLTVQSDAGQFCIQSNTTPGKQLQIGYDHTTNNSYLTSLEQGVAFTNLLLQPNGGNVGIGTSVVSTGYVGGNGSLTLQNSKSIAFNNFSNAWNTTSAGGAITYFTDNNLYIDAKDSASNMIFRVNGATERMRITSGGAIGMNTSSPDSATVLTLRESSSLSGALSMLNRNGNQRWSLAVDAFAVDDKYFSIIDNTNSAVRMVITPSGNVGIGTSSPQAKFSIGSPGAITSFPTYSTNDLASIGWNYFALGDELYVRSMDIVSKGAPDGTNGGSIMRFLTTPITNGSAALERMRITSDGRFLVRTSSVLNPGGVSGVSNMLNPDNNGLWALAIQNNATTNSYGRGLAIRNSTDFNNGDNEFLFLIGNNTPRLYV